MKFIRAATVNDAALASSNVVETPPAAYNSGTTYALAGTASIFSGPSNTLATVYESLQNANTNNAPASSPAWWRAIGTAYLAYNGATSYAELAVVTDTTKHRLMRSLVAANMGNPLTDATKWQDIGPSNRWAMLDDRTGTQTMRPMEVRDTFNLTGRIDTAAVLNVTASQISLAVWAGDTPRTNLLPWSAQIDQWYPVDTSVTANAASAPDGSMTADRVTVSATYGGPLESVTLTAATTYTFSAHLQAGNVDWAYLTVYAAGPIYAEAHFDLVTGATGSTGAGGGAIASHSAITDLGGGWLRCEMTFTVPTTGSYSLFLRPAVADATHSASGNTLLAWGAQLEAAGAATQYIETDGSALTVTGERYFDRTYSMVSTRGITDWWRYLFEPIVYRTDLLIPDLPNVGNPTVKFIATSTGTVAVGQLVMGLSAYIGETERGARLGIRDRSRVDEDEFGVTFVTKRPSDRRGTFEVWIDERDSDFVFDLLTSLSGTVVTMIGDDRYGSTFQHGLLVDWNEELRHETRTIVSIEFRGI